MISAKWGKADLNSDGQKGPVMNQSRHIYEYFIKLFKRSAAAFTNSWVSKITLPYHIRCMSFICTRFLPPRVRVFIDFMTEAIGIALLGKVLGKSQS